jgi:AcrR family transcriptional regulator
MRYTEEQKAKTRKRMIEAISQSFRSHGYAGIGVDGIAQAAGVTSGAFYNHFGSKSAAFNAAVKAGLDEVISGIPQFQRKHGKGWVKAFSDYYLGQAHREDSACGCAMTTLTPEVTRSDEDLRDAFEARMKIIVDLMAEGLSGKSNKDRRGRAWAMLSVLIGGLNFARAMKTAKVADEIADTIKAAAIKAAGKTRKVKRNGK